MGLIIGNINAVGKSLSKNGIPGILLDGNTEGLYDYKTYVEKDGAGLVSAWDDRLNPGYGSNVVVNGDFETDTDWLKGAGWSINTTTKVAQAVATTGNLTQSAILTIGITYRITITILNYVSGSIRINAGGSSSLAITGNQTYSAVLLATVSGNLILDGVSSFTGDIDNVIVEEVLGNHLFQGEGSKQPLYTQDGILFDGIDNFLKSMPFTWNQPNSIYIVFNPITYTIGRYIFDGYGLLTGSLFQNIAYPRYGINASLTVDILSGPTNGSDTIMRVLFNGINSEAIVKNETPYAGDAGIDTMGGFTLGKNGDSVAFSNIRVKEAILRSIADTPGDKQDIYNYLSNKYGIS